MLRYIAFALLACTPAPEDSATGPTLVVTNSDGFGPGTPCEGYVGIRPAWDEVDDPCLLVEGLVFQRECSRIGFVGCTLWESGFDFEGRSYVNETAYHCSVDESGDPVLRWYARDNTLDLETRTIGTFELVGTDLAEDFAKWFPELVNRYENQAPGYPATEDGVCI